MKGSIYAKEIDQEYRRRKYYENRIKKKDKEKCDKRVERKKRNEF